MPESASGTEPEQNKPSFVSAYAIFEGGGAKGIAHVGALRAMEKAGLALLGVAGTSAGAIFAALVAVGYKPDEIFKSGDNHILTSLGLGSPVDLIGKNTWRQIKALKNHGIHVAVGIIISTLLSTVLGAIVLGRELGDLASFAAILVTATGATLLATGLVHRLIWAMPAWQLVAISFSLGLGACLLGLYLPDYRALTTFIAGIALGTAIALAIRSARILFFVGAAAALFVAASLQWGTQWPQWIVPIILFAAMLYSSIIAMRWLRPLLSHQGLIDNQVVRDIVNKALLAKLAEIWDEKVDGKLPDEVKFKHIEPNPDRNKFIPLKVVTTNVDQSRLVIVDRRHPEVSVAQAVAASAALPLLFRPAQIEGLDDQGHRYADGGLVSNLPSWVFRDEKRQQERFEAFKARQFRRIPVFAIALEDPAKPAPLANSKFEQWMSLRSSIGYFQNLASMAVFGSQGVVQSFISDLRVIPVQTKLKTMSLDCSGDEAEDQVTKAQEQVLGLLRREEKRDRLTMAILEFIRSKITPEMHKSLKTQHNSTETVRVVLLDPLNREKDGKPVSLRVKMIAGGGAETNTDDELELDLEGNIAAAAFKSGSITFGQLGGIGAGPLMMTKYEHALLPGHLRTAVAIPILDKDGRAERVVSVDSRDDLLPLKDDKAFYEMLISLCLPLRSDLFEQSMERKSHDQ